MSRAAASRVAAAAGPSSPTPRGGRRGRGCAGCVSGGGGGGGGEGGGGGGGGEVGGGEGGRGEKDAAAAGSAGHAPPSPPPLRTYSRAGLAALDEVLRRDAMPLLTFAQPSAAKCKRDMDALFDALDTDGVGLWSPTRSCRRCSRAEPPPPPLAVPRDPDAGRRPLCSAALADGKGSGAKRTGKLVRAVRAISITTYCISLVRRIRSTSGVR